MKKLLAICILGLSLGTAGVFADHPGGWGVGILGRGGYGFSGGGLGGLAFSLKAPQLPVYWGINLDLNGGYFGLGVTGDYYFMEGILVPNVGDGFGYFIGVGGFLGFGTWTGGTYYDGKGNSYKEQRTDLELGARLPLGLNVVIPISSIKLEVFLDLAPSIGIGFHFWNKEYTDNHSPSAIGLGGSVAGELGVRVWF